MDDVSSFVVIHNVNNDDKRIDDMDPSTAATATTTSTANSSSYTFQPQQQQQAIVAPALPPVPPTTPRSGDGIVPRMREQDADLLETMHYAASQVSQYSPHGTPVLRPQDRSLPMEDVPLLQLLPLASTSDLLMPIKESSGSFNSSSSSSSGKNPNNNNNNNIDANNNNSNNNNNINGSNRSLSSSFKNSNTDTGGDGFVVGGNDIEPTTLMQRLSLLEPHQQQQQVSYVSSSPAPTRKVVRFPIDTESSTDQSPRLAYADLSCLKGETVLPTEKSTINDGCQSVQTAPAASLSQQVQPPPPPPQPPTLPPTTSSCCSSDYLPRLKLRRLLSGEVRTIPKDDDDLDDDEEDDICCISNTATNTITSTVGDVIQQQQRLDGGSTIVCASIEAISTLTSKTIETEAAKTEVERGLHSEVEVVETHVVAASPISVARTKTDQEEGLAELRRRNEAIQFAKAVGEEIAINRNDLRIIEDHQDYGDDFDDDDDDDEAIESKEIMITNSSTGSQYHIHHDELTMIMPPPTTTGLLHESFHSLSLSLPTSSDTTGIVLDTPQKVSSFLDSKQQSQSGGVLFDGESPARTASLPLPGRPGGVPGSAHHHRRKSRPMWPFEQPSDMDFTFMEHLSDGVGDRTNFVYKGIQANPPEITKRGIQRGNYAQLHRKAWLEVSDKYHRYGKNLRLYYRFWERLGFPTNSFFDWLDSKGEAAGEPLPNMEECPRSVLDSDTVLYITNPSITDRYAIDITVGIDDDGRGRAIDVDGDPVLTGSEGWIFVLRDNIMYAAAKITSITGQSKERFHHSSFFGGKAVASAGIIITDDMGYLTRLYPHSGHYRPGEAHTQRMLLFLHRKGVDLRTFEMDTQQLTHVSREKETKGGIDDSGIKKKSKDDTKEKEEKKMKKVDSLHLERAVDVACMCSFQCTLLRNMMCVDR
jgi:hypothetical protein